MLPLQSLFGKCQAGVWRLFSIYLYIRHHELNDRHNRPCPEKQHMLSLCRRVISTLNLGVATIHNEIKKCIPILSRTLVNFNMAIEAIDRTSTSTEIYHMQIEPQ